MNFSFLLSLHPSRTGPPDQVFDLYQHLGFTTAPSIPLPVAEPGTIESSASQEGMALGQEIGVTPLQMALAAAALSKNGALPNPVLALAIKTPGQGWQAFGGSVPAIPALTSSSVISATRLLERPDAPIWETVAVVHQPNRAYTWYLSGTLPFWQGSPLALALLLEEDNPVAAQNIGRQMIESTLKPQ